MKKIRVILVMLLVLTMSIFGLSGCKDDDSKTVEPTVFEQFENALIEKNLTFEKVTMAADLVGAEQGIKYKLQNENVELYRFDTSSDSYVVAEETQSLKMDGFGSFDATVIDGYAMLSDNLEFINIFKGIMNN